MKSDDRVSHYASANMISTMQFYLDYNNLSKRSFSLTEKEDITSSTLDKSQIKNPIKRRFTNDQLDFKDTKKTSKLKAKKKLEEIASTPNFNLKMNFSESLLAVL